MASLEEYKAMALDEGKHIEMIKDTSCIDFLVYSLDTDDVGILEITLDILQLFVDNPSTYSLLKNCSPLIENLRLIYQRSNVAVKIKQRAKDIDSQLFKVIQSVPSTPKKSPFSSVQNTYMFHVGGLYSQNESQLESSVIRMKGVISIQVDVEHQRCVVRTAPTLDQYQIAQRIVDLTHMRPRLIAKNKNQQEVFIDILNPKSEIEEENSEEDSEDDLPPYLPEEDDDEEAFHPKSVLSFQYIRANASTLIHSAARIINSIYC